ncbi:hypothetical protein EJ110_NYTH58473, partial [Nymphaea thermarum]
MAELLGSPKNAGLDAGSASKAENVPIQVTSIRLIKDNYLSWSAALEIGITSCGRLSYITGDKPAPLKSYPQWETWALEDSQVKVWIISSVSSDIQPLILRKPTSFDMWTVLAKMYGRKKRHLRTYQIKRSIYSLTQGDLSVAAFYAALKTKWEELDYHVTDEWKCAVPQVQGSVLLGVALTATSWVTLQTFVGIFILRRGWSEVGLPLAGAAPLCLTPVRALLLVSHRLYGHVDGTTPAPPKYTNREVKRTVVGNEVAGSTAGNEIRIEYETVDNPEHELWMAHDQSLVAYITSTLSKEVLGSIDDDLTALELWTTLATTYSQVSEARFLQLRRQFQDIKRGTRSVLEYLNEIKN